MRCSWFYFLQKQHYSQKIIPQNDQLYSICLDTIYQCMDTQIHTICSYLIISWINPNCPGHAKIWYFNRCLSGNQNIPCCQISMYKFFLLQISHALEKWCVVERKCMQIHNFVPNRYLQVSTTGWRKSALQFWPHLPLHKSHLHFNKSYNLCRNQ